MNSWQPLIRTSGADTPDYSNDVGKVFSTVTEVNATYQLTGNELYICATIARSKPPVNPTAESPYQKAWPQPVGWRTQIKK